jgi:hypothetical protein
MELDKGKLEQAGVLCQALNLVRDLQLDPLLEDTKHQVMNFEMEGMPKNIIGLERTLK